jgi:hypothetical protein
MAIPGAQTKFRNGLRNSQRHSAGGGPIWRKNGFVRGQGVEPEEGKDLTQGFFALLLERGGLDREGVLAVLSATAA